MKNSFIKNSIKIDAIINQLDSIKTKYDNAELKENQSKSLISSYIFIHSMEPFAEVSESKGILSTLIETGLKILLLEKEDHNNFLYFIKLILDTKSENEYYNAISHLYSSEDNNNHPTKEKYLLDSMLYIADRYLFCDFDIVKFNKWYKLIEECKINKENEDYRKKNTTISKQGFFKYAAHNNPDKKAIRLLISMLDNEVFNYDQTSIDYINPVYEYYFSIKKDLSDLKTARDVFLQILSITNKTVVYMARHIKKQSLTNEEKNRIIELLFISYDNDFAPYVSSLKKESGNVYDTAMSIIESIEMIDVIKQTLLVDKIDNNNLAYYTTMNSFSFMLPFRNKGDKSDKAGMLPLMNISYMNDPTEGSVLFRYLHITKNNKERKIASYPYIYIKSFTSLVDYLPMWEMYADKGKGICVVLDWEK